MNRQINFELLVALFCCSSILLIQLAECNSIKADNNEGANEDSSMQKPSLLAASNNNKENLAALPVLIVRQQSGSSSSSSGSDGKKNKPDFFLIWLQPYQDMIPKPIMQMIDQQVRPQTEQISQQVLSQVPGGEQFWSQLSQFQSSINNAGGLSSIIGSATGTSGGSGESSNPLSSLMQNFGRRRR